MAHLKQGLTAVLGSRLHISAAAKHLQSSPVPEIYCANLSCLQTTEHRPHLMATKSADHGVQKQFASPGTTVLA